MTVLYSQVTDWSNLLLAFRLAAKGKRGKSSAAGFEHQLADRLIQLQREFHARWDEYCAGKITFAEFDASVKGWVNHVRYADTWGLRTHIFRKGLVFQKPK
ncbi:MAG: hypothetical protein JST85_08050 [Acidobacteria bacterium]|nr:hypothetical protein [Acidobacteriota bacterium]